MDANYFGDLLWGAFLVTFLVLLNGFFVAAEFAIVKIRESQLQPLIKKGHKRAKVAERIVKNLDASLSATQLGITLASLGLGWFAEPIFARLLGPFMNWVGIESESMRHSVSTAVGIGAITFLHVVAGEVAPKSLAIQRSLPTTLWIALPLHWFYKVTYPFIWMLNTASTWLLKQVGIQPASEGELVHSEEELRLLFTSTQQHSGGTALGREIVLNALSLRRRIAREVMRPRQEIVCFNTESTIAECVDLAERTRYSRFPLCEGGDLDRSLGVIHIKDLYALRTRATTAKELNSVMRRIIYVPETARLERLLQLFLERKLHFAFVVDEYGGTTGMLTIENILEELVGQIQDEFDQEKPLMTQAKDGRWELDGALPLHELAELVGEPLQEEGVTTTSGWITQQLGGFPKEGDVVSVSGNELRVEETDGPRVLRVRLTKAAPVLPPDQPAS